MTLTRWKMMAGVLGLSLGGLAALAESPSCTPGKGGPTAKAAPPVIPVEMPVVPVAGVVPVVASPADLTPAAPALPPAEAAPAPREAEGKKDKKHIELNLPLTPLVGVDVKMEAPLVPAAPVATPPAVPVVAAPVEVAPAPAPQPVAVQPAPTPAPAPAPMTLSASEKRFRVMLNMGDDRPRFEVRDGDEAVLKVVCEKVDVKSPADRGETMSQMKAVGGVAFITPGGEGTCDELSLAPGTGQVVVTGKVKFKYNWGKVETEVSGDRMTFRLGSAPGMSAAAAAAPSATPVSFQKPIGR